MTEQEEYLYNEMTSDFKESVDTIIHDLSADLGKELTLLSEVPLDTVKEYLHCEGFYVYADYADKLTTPYSIMKYIQLYNNEAYVSENLKKYLDGNFKDENYTYHIVKKFRNELIFENNIKKAQLKILYNYDPEEDKFDFYLPGQNYNFNVSFEIIKAILSGKTPKINTTDNKVINNLEDTHMTLTYAGLKITIEKQ